MAASDMFSYDHHSLQPDGTYKTLIDSQNVSIHPSSILHGRKPDCVLYNELVIIIILHVLLH
jgi:hypothetical protein